MQERNCYTIPVFSLVHTYNVISLYSVRSLMGTSDLLTHDVFILIFFFFFLFRSDKTLAERVCWEGPKVVDNLGFLDSQIGFWCLHSEWIKHIFLHRPYIDSISKVNWYRFTIQAAGYSSLVFWIANLGFPMFLVKMCHNRMQWSKRSNCCSTNHLVR